MSDGDTGQAGGGATLKSLFDDLNRADNDDKTWGQWAAEKAIAAEHVAAQSAIKVKDTAVSTVKYVAAAAASKFPNVAETATGNDAPNADVSSGDKTISVQDLVDRYSSTLRTPEAGQRSVTKGLLDTGLTSVATITAQTRNIAETLKQSTISAATPGDGDKELAKTVTATLSSLPTLLKEQVWISSRGQKEELSLDPGLGGMSTPIQSATAAVHGLESSTASDTSFKTGQETENRIGSEKLMELWTMGNATLECNADMWTIGNGALECKVDNEPTDSQDILSPRSPKTPRSASAVGATKYPNAKAEAIADAHRSRVIADANVFVEGELSKAEAHAQKLLAIAESQRLQEEAKALESLKKEELRAQLLVHSAEVKAEKLLAEAKSKAASIGLHKEEEFTKAIVDARTKAEMSLAEIEEIKQREIAELQDRVEQMILMREFPLPPPEHKRGGVVKKVKEKVMSRMRGY